MRILHIVPSLAPGGAERFAVDLTAELAKNKYDEVHLCTTINKQNKNSLFYSSQLSNNVIYHNIKSPFNKPTFLAKFINIFQFIYLITRIKPEIVHSHIQSFRIIALSSLLFRKIKFIDTIHNDPYKIIPEGFEKSEKSFFYKNFIKGVTISTTCYNNFGQYLGFNNTVMIENGCREINTTLDLENVKNEIEKLKPISTTTVFIHIGRLEYQKNQQLLIESFNKLIENGYDAVLLIFGGITDSQIYENLLTKVKTNRIHFLGTRSNILDYLSYGDAFCLSSLWEGAPISLLEAGFSGCYALSTPVCGCKDVIVNSKIGLLSEDFSTDSYYKILKRYMDDEKKPRNNIKEIYLRKYTMAECSVKYKKLYTKLISEKT